MQRKRMSVFLFSAILTGPLAMATSGHADMIGVQFFKGNFQLDSINTTTGVQTAIGNTGIDRLNSLATTPSGALYSIGGPSQFDQNHLITINPQTGAGTDLGTLNFDVAPPPTASFQINGLASDASGSLYGVMVNFSGPQALYRINPTTRNATQINANLGFSPLGLDFSPDGTLYASGLQTAGKTALYTLNTTTGEPTPIGTPLPSSSPSFALQSIAFDEGGTLWGITSSMGDPSGSGRIYTIDPATGVATLKFGTGLSNDFRGIEFVQPVPVPAALWLFGSGLAAVAGFARRSGQRKTA